MNDPLVGKFFHSKKDDRVEWQGQIKAVIQTFSDDKYYLIETYEWITGGTAHMQICHLSNMLDWNIYNTNEEMNDWFEHHASPHEQGKQ